MPATCGSFWARDQVQAAAGTYTTVVGILDPLTTALGLGSNLTSTVIQATAVSFLTHCATVGTLAHLKFYENAVTYFSIIIIVCVFILLLAISQI